MIAAKGTPMKLPLRIGLERFGVYNPNTIYAPGEVAVAEVFGINLHSTLADVEKSGNCAEGLEWARFIVRAVNSHAALVAFACEIIASHTGTLDGCDIEEIAVRHGLLKAVEVTEPCRDEDVGTCPCAECGFPTNCYRLTEILTEGK